MESMNNHKHNHDHKKHEEREVNEAHGHNLNPMNTKCTLSMSSMPHTTTNTCSRILKEDFLFPQF